MNAREFSGVNFCIQSETQFTPKFARVLENSPVLTSVFESELEAQFTPSHSEYLPAAWPQYHS